MSSLLGRRGKETSLLSMVSSHDTLHAVVIFDQAEFDIRCEWGSQGLRTLAPISDVVVIVDVLSFSTAVDIGVAQGGIILPYPLKGAAAASYAQSVGAHLASP